MASFLFQNWQATDKSHSHMLYLISCHPSFKLKVNDFLQLLPTDFNSDALSRLTTLVFTFLLPDLPFKQARLMATQLVQQTQSSTSAVTYNTLLELLLRLCSFAVENIDVRSAIGFLEIVYTRITDVYIVEVSDPTRKRKIISNLKLEVFNAETILTDSGLAEKHHREEVKHVYFEQKIERGEEVVHASQVMQVELKTQPEEVIPWGYLCEDYIHELVNSNFANKYSYRLKKCRKLSGLDKVDYYVTHNEAVGNLVRDYMVNQEVFLTSGLITAAHLPEQISPALTKSFPVSRLSQTFARQNYLQKLKELTTSENKYFNILSEYFQRDEFNIDELNLTREKLIVRRKESVLGISGKETVRKEAKDYQEEHKNITDSLWRNLAKFHDGARCEEGIKDLQNGLRFVLEEDKSISQFLERHISKHSHCDKDPVDTFHQDVVALAALVPLQLVILGRPKCGKTTLAKAIAKNYGLVYISVESMVDKVFERVKFYEESPPETDEDGNPKEGLLPIQKCIIGDLSKGKSCEQEDLLDLINNQLQREATLSRGFILDLPFEYSKFWSQSLIANIIRMPKISCRYFTHIIQIEQTEEQWKYFLSGLMEKPEDSTLTSAYDRYMLKKVKPPVLEGEEEEAEEEPAEGEKPAPLVQANLLKVYCKESSFNLLEHFTVHIHPHDYLKVHNSYQNVQESLAQLAQQLYKIPVAKKLEGADKELLGVGLEEAKVFRKWSPWGTIDAVELQRGKLLAGKNEFAAEYAGRVFLFQNQNNLAQFLSLPRKFLGCLPQLPKTTNIFITGPRKSGKKTIARLLSQIYDLKVVNLQEIMESVIEKQRHFETHVPSNFERRVNSIHLSEPEFKEFSKGNAISAKDILPIVLFHLGVTMQKKPLGWGVEKTEEEATEQKDEEKKPAAKKAKKKEKTDDDRPKTPPPEDLSLKDLIPEINHLGKLNEVRGYIWIGYPNNEDQLNALKGFNIPIDKLIILSDNTEENPNRNLVQRLSESELEQAAAFMAGIVPVKEALTEEFCREILIDKSPEDICNKIRQIVDPFYLKTDDDAINRVCADKQEEGDPISLGFCGDYCPVVLKDGFLIKGKDEFEAGVQGKRFKFAGEKELAAFKENPNKYLHKENAVVAPRVLFMGIRGVGLKTQLLKLNEKYRIPILSFKETLLKQLDNEKAKRKAERYYSKGFKKVEVDEEGKEIEDAELNDDGPDFDRKANEIEVVRNIFNGLNEIFINANFYDTEEDKVSTNLVELLAEARKLPELVFMLTSDEGKWLDRVLDKKAIEKELESMKAKKREEKEKEREEAKKKAQQTGEQYQEPPTEDEDAELPKLQELIAQKEQSLKAQREADASKLEEYSEAFKQLGIEIVTIKCERESKHVTDRINYMLKDVLEDRVNRWEKNSMLAIERSRVKAFTDNYIALDSRFGKLNPFTLMANAKNYPLIYRDRIYYLSTEEEREQVIRNPQLLKQNQPVPHDVGVSAGVFVIGKAKSGKTTLADSLQDKLGWVKVTLEQIVEDFAKEHLDHDIAQILHEVRSGKPLTDEAIVCLLQKRLSMADCSQGWVLDGLPTNKRQAELLSRKGVVPSVVLSLKLSQLDIKKRVISSKSTAYDNLLEIVHARLQATSSSILEAEVYYSSKHNNVEIIEGKLSKWGVFEQARKAVELKIKSKRQFIRDVSLQSAADVSHVGMSFNCIIHNLSEYSNYCVISYKIRREYAKLCLRNYHYLALFDRKFYVFKGQKELDDFLANPTTFVSRAVSFTPPENIKLEEYHAFTAKVENKGYCMVELVRKKLEKSSFWYGLSYKGKYYLTCTAANMKTFIKNPSLYQLARLPDKLAVEVEKKSDLKKIAKKNDCSAFLEHHLSNIMMRSLAQLGYRRPKYPTLGSKESALKFLSMSLKANNPNKDDEYRQKYAEKLNRFIKECNYSQEIRNELDRKAGGDWQSHDEENLTKLCEEYNAFLKQLESTDKNAYFSVFIR